MTATTWNNTRPWRGIMVATALPLRDDLSVDYDAYAEHVRWLIEHGCDGVVPNGSLGEYQTLTDEERARVMRTAVDAAGDGARVMPGVAAYGSAEARRWAELAGEAGCGSVLLLPPNAFRADEQAVRAHYAEAAKAGVPVVAYNNPIDTKVDLTPGLLARLHQDGSIVAVKEFSGDVRRAYQLAELAPELDLLIGADDVLLELAVAGAVGWIAGYPNAFPTTCAELYNAAVAGDLDTALPLYKSLHSLLRWDSKTEFVQCIKLSMDIVGRRGGPTRPPRFPLTGEIEAEVRADTEKAVADGHR
ncbi:dihydrodipicolinate synthase family protein [Streptomyces lunaelactis]|uniref:dihydrodipicolinate synthase family protein n=2 Tax=Streptomyces lunaelactis TaxID=1535768 RepID=UPI0015851009|nr:dihydrodipicolinate synthase family protein [Streptomyces lunaelactis]NUK01176.1 dihydrodipicolinate synthase family protein [Streptomyces lunaelactis]NUK12116.1 dihydrodipicolinate synthase family protein [Streptomyces lunaelactis]NUK15173.1 dihydrodipicolinate synthase family protein [Streptomyces lunaelactis]NUK41114.1 dihydrodipicolinate synthase family protein [Streptomyces lunaelactis]NUK49999.1 dihydrodipicolinate synthase family protein [Streptomyces lunaelactis]